MDSTGKEMVEQLASQMAGLSSGSDVVNVGDVLDERYQLVEIIGRGGCGVVFRALDQNLQRDVAVKVLSAEGLSQDNTFSRFEQESQILRRLHSPNTVYFYDYGMTPQQVPYIVMEYVVGKQLKSILETENSLPPKRAVAILVQVLSSLNEAHGYGFVHRDLKPSNIMLCQRMGFPDDFVKVLDFGIAKIFDSNEPSSSGSDANEEQIDEDVVGTPNYMAPELFKNQPFTPQSDLYSLGCIAYEMLTGIAPFDAETLHATVAKHLFSDPPPMGEAFDPYPNLVATVYKLLAKKASERFESAQLVMEALEHWNDPDLIPALADMALVDDIEEQTETTQRPDAGFFDPNLSPENAQLQEINAGDALSGNADKSRKLMIVLAILAVVFVGAIVGIMVYWNQAKQTTVQEDIVLPPPPPPAPMENRISEKTLTLVGLVMTGNSANSIAYGIQDREVLIHIDDLMYGYDEPSEKTKEKGSSHRESGHRRAKKVAKEALPQPAEPAVTSFTISYKPENARFGMMNGTGSCSLGKCKITPVNPDAPCRIVISANGYLPKSVILKPSVSSYNIELKPSPSN